MSEVSLCARESAGNAERIWSRNSAVAIRRPIRRHFFKKTRGGSLSPGKRRLSPGERDYLAAIVEHSSDAIVTKDLDGYITSWNRTAERIFGYTADEAIGQHVTMLIPPEKHDEEPEILAKIRSGERIEPYDTVRQCRDGKLIYISLTVSPIRDAKGVIVGASKIARDITERFEAQGRQRLLMQEMEHRVKNAFALAGSLITVCASRAETPAELAKMARQRLGALAAAHELTVRRYDPANDESKELSLHELLHLLLSPYLAEGDERFTLSGDDVPLTSSAVTPLALVLNELATNASKHGALRDDFGTIAVVCSRAAGKLLIRWSERCEGITEPPSREGFGTQLSRTTVESQLGGQLIRDWSKGGLTVTMTIDADRLLR